MANGEEETTPPPETSENGLLERVADILGIDEEDLIDAFKQARQEICEDVFTSRLEKAVEEGYITQEQADEILKWWNQRPDDAIEAWRGQGRNDECQGMFKHNLRFRATPGFRMQNMLGARFCPRLPAEAD